MSDSSPHSVPEAIRCRNWGCDHRPMEEEWQRLVAERDALRQVIRDHWSTSQAAEILARACPAAGVEYVCAHDHKWHTSGLPTRCPMCNTSTFAASSPAKERDA